MKNMLIIEENNQITEWILDGKEYCMLGRVTPGNEPDIQSFSPIVSRQHGQFIKVNEQWFYTDIGSMNGTFNNGKKIKTGMNGKKKPVMLSDGDELRIDSEYINESDMRHVVIKFRTFLQ